MLITKTSMQSGKVNTLEIGVTQDQLDAWNNGELIQNAMPDLSPDEREFLMTGVTSEEWDEMFLEDEDNTDDETDDEKLQELNKLNQMTDADRLDQGMVSDICRPRKF
jgi:hypothetical protein